MTLCPFLPDLRIPPEGGWNGETVATPGLGHHTSLERALVDLLFQPADEFGRPLHGPDLDLPAQLEPLFEKSGANVSFARHDHVYDRLKPQHGVNYFVMGNSGEPRAHDLRPSSETAIGFDTDRAFMMAEIAWDEFHFQTIAHGGEAATRRPPLA